MRRAKNWVKPNAIIRIFNAKGEEVSIGKAHISDERINLIKDTFRYNAEKGTWFDSYPLTNEIGSYEVDLCL